MKSLTLDKFTIHKPEEWDQEVVEVEIRDYDYDSTKIKVEDLRALHSFIGEIINVKEDGSSKSK